LGDSIFTGDPSRQLANTKWFPANELWAVTDVETACSALKLIVEQGEGSSKSPTDEEGELAHYYRFAEIYYGKRLVKDAGSPVGWSFSGEPVPLNPEDVYNLRHNAKAQDYPEGSTARRYADQTNYTYSSLLNSLHHTFNGEPQQLDHAMGLMYELRLSVQKMVTIDLGNGEFAAPPFRYGATSVGGWCMPNPFVFHEIVTPAPFDLGHFYGEVFGWRFQRIDDRGTLYAIRSPTPGCAPVGLLTKASGGP